MGSIIEKNRKAAFNYFLLERIEAGIVLLGSEIKSIRTGAVSIMESFVIIHRNELFIRNMYIGQYKFASVSHEERRDRKLLLHRKEISKIDHKLQVERLSLIPTCIYFKNGKVKLELAIAKGKKLYDKRAAQAKKTVERKLRSGVLD
jgi:SsrA-binding protein